MRSRSCCTSYVPECHESREYREQMCVYEICMLGICARYTYPYTRTHAHTHTLTLTHTYTHPNNTRPQSNAPGLACNPGGAVTSPMFPKSNLYLAIVLLSSLSSLLSWLAPCSPIFASFRLWQESIQSLRCSVGLCGPP